MRHVRGSLSVRRHHAEVELERISQRRHTFRATGVLGHDYSLLPLWHVATNPASDDRLGVQVVDRASKEALHLRCVQVDRDNVLDASDVKQVGQHAGGDSASVRLFLGLAAVGKVWKDSCKKEHRRQQNEHDNIFAAPVTQTIPVILLAEPPLQALIMISSSMMESLILGLPDWTTKTSFSRTLVRIRTLVSPFGPKG